MARADRRLAEMAERNSRTDVVYETPTRRAVERQQPAEKDEP
jgi:hypothetical protein